MQVFGRGRFLMPPGMLSGSLFEVIWAPSWRQVGPKGGFWKVGNLCNKKHEQRETQVAVEACGPRTCGPLKGTEDWQTADQQTGRRQTSRPLQALETLHCVPRGHGGAADLLRKGIWKKYPAWPDLSPSRPGVKY